MLTNLKSDMEPIFILLTSAMQAQPWVVKHTLIIILSKKECQQNIILHYFCILKYAKVVTEARIHPYFLVYNRPQIWFVRFPSLVVT